MHEAQAGRVAPRIVVALVFVAACNGQQSSAANDGPISDQTDATASGVEPDAGSGSMAAPDAETPVAIQCDSPWEHIPARFLTAGTGLTCARTCGGCPVCFGRNAEGEMGLGSMRPIFSTPVLVDWMSDALQVAASHYFTCALKRDGTVWCAGYNGSGQLGNGTAAQGSAGFQRTPTQVVGVANATALTTGKTASCARIYEGEPRRSRYVCWGADTHGEVSGAITVAPRVVPIEIPFSPDEVRQMDPGYEKTCVVKTDRTVWCWGLADASGVLASHGADGVLLPPETPAPILMDASRSASGRLEGVDEVSVGLRHACARKGDGTVWCWGQDEGDMATGLLGDGPAKLGPSMTVKVATDQRVMRLSVAQDHACAVTEFGRLLCWGDNRYGQLGDGTNIDRDAPIEVPGLVDIVDVTTARYHTCARGARGQVWCMGANASGEIGDSYLGQNRRTPFQVLGGCQ